MTKLTEDSKTNIRLCREASKKCFPNHPLLQELSLCQAILESGLQNNIPSKLASEYCNLFGMKPGSVARVGTLGNGIVTFYTTEYNSITGKKEKLQQDFLANEKIEDSFKQHEQLLSNLSRYKNLFSAATFDKVARLIREDGYATDPSYTSLLMDIHRKYCR